MNNLAQEEIKNRLKAAQQHSTFTVQILYKLYSVQMNCTYSNSTEDAATCSGAHRSEITKMMSSAVQRRHLYEKIQSHIIRE